jgi:hypothetical protein
MSGYSPDPARTDGQDCATQKDGVTLARANAVITAKGRYAMTTAHRAFVAAYRRASSRCFELKSKCWERIIRRAPLLMGR